MNRRDFLSFVPKAGLALGLPASLTTTDDVSDWSDVWAEYFVSEWFDEPAVTGEVHEGVARAMLRRFEDNGYREIRGFHYHEFQYHRDRAAWLMTASAWMR